VDQAVADIAAVNQLVSSFQSALYRDFPDPHRKRGEEKF